MEIPIVCPGCRHKFRLKAANPHALMEKTFQCPKCGACAPFSAILGGGSVPGANLETHLGAAPGGLDTHLASKQQNAPAKPLETHLGAGAPGHLKTHIAGQGNPQQPNPLETHIAGSGAYPSRSLSPNAGGAAFQGSSRTDGLFGVRAMLLVPALRRQFQLPPGQYILGRESNDSQANVRLAPDPCMSRRHAHLQVDNGPGGTPVVTLTSLQSSNHIFINGAHIYPGTTVRLNPGDEMLLGETTVKFILREL